MFYFGYVGMMVFFVMVVVVLLCGKFGVIWLLLLCNWLFVLMVFLMFGIMFGGWWFYEVFGWGGYWVWDLVENVLFLLWFMVIVVVYFVVV